MQDMYIAYQHCRQYMSENKSYLSAVFPPNAGRNQLCLLLLGGNADVVHMQVLYTRVIKFLRLFEFHNKHLMRGGLMLPDYISEEKLKID